MGLEVSAFPERSVFQRLLPATMVIALLLAFLAGVTWFIRAFILPPRVAIPSPVAVAAAPPADVSPSARETSSEPSMAPPSAAPSEPDASAPPVPEPTAPSRSTTTTINDLATTGSAPPVSPAGIAAAPIAPVPLPRPRGQEFVAIAGPVPPPSPRREARTRTRSPIYNRHRAE